MLKRTLAVIPAVIMGAMVPGHGAMAADLGSARCAALKDKAPPHTTINKAEQVPAGSFNAPDIGFPMPADYSKLPAFCRVAGSIKPTADSDIRFELWLPLAGWNGRFLQTGNGGAAGNVIYPSLVEPLMKGYAVANTDTGHHGGMGEFTWVPGHAERYTDYAWRAVHELTVAAKELVRAAYAKRPEKAYWLGCSTGGRQGLKEVQRFPEDYDAVVAGAPAANWSPLATFSVVTERTLDEPGGLHPDQLAMLKEAVLARCDSLDGVSDRVVTEPGRCDFDPAQLLCKPGQTEHCLSEAAVAGARRMYAGLRTASGAVRIPGMGLASEAEWAAAVSPQFRIGSSYYRNVVKKDPAWDAAQFSLDRDLAQADAVDAGETIAMDPHIERFLAHGGRLLLYHGTADGMIPFGNTANYYESVVAAVGAARAQKGVRMYAVPGMGHCMGGEGASQIDWLGAMEQWEEHGVAPGTLLGTHPAGPLPGGAAANGAAAPVTTFTRPVCVYPAVPRYSGSGDQNAAASFHCVKP